jgi:hypothetical protein
VTSRILMLAFVCPSDLLETRNDRKRLEHSLMSRNKLISCWGRSVRRRSQRDQLIC